MCAAKWLFPLVASSVLAQSPADLFQKAPPAVDEALRGRVSKFYQAYVDGKFRAATEYVAEDSQDTFFEADKRRCRRFEIIRINYESNFSNATVLINCDTDMLLPPSGLTKVTMPLSSKWKMEEGKWMWYVPKLSSRQSPFGEMKPGEGEADVVKLPRGPSVIDVMKMLAVDRTSMRVVAGAAFTDEFLITSNMEGVVRLTLEAVKSPDVTARLEKSELKGKESAKLFISYQPKPELRRLGGMTEDIRVVAEPIHKVLPLKLLFVAEE